MKFIVPFSFIVLLLSQSSCNPNKSKADEAISTIEKQEFPFNVGLLSDGAQLDLLRKEVASLISDRRKNNREDLSDLTYYYALPLGTDRKGKPVAPKEFAGMWIKFDNSYTYYYGKKKLYGSGVFHYSPTDKLLIMLDDDEQIEPKMWEFLFNSEQCNFNGRPLRLVKDKQEQEFLLTSNFANDAYFSTIETLVHVPNNSQILMNLSEINPLKDNK